MIDNSCWEAYSWLDFSFHSKSRSKELSITEYMQKRTPHLLTQTPIKWFNLRPECLTLWPIQLSSLGLIDKNCTECVSKWFNTLYSAWYKVKCPYLTTGLSSLLLSLCIGMTVCLSFIPYACTSLREITSNTRDSFSVCARELISLYGTQSGRSQQHRMNSFTPFCPTPGYTATVFLLSSHKPQVTWFVRDTGSFPFLRFVPNLHVRLGTCQCSFWRNNTHTWSFPVCEMQRK